MVGWDGMDGNVGNVCMYVCVLYALTAKYREEESVDWIGWYVVFLFYVDTRFFFGFS